MLRPIPMRLSLALCALGLVGCDRTPATQGPAPEPDALSALTATAHEAPDAARRDVPTVDVPRLGPLTIDGRLDEPAWASAGATGPFVAPGSGEFVADSPVRSAALLGYDDTHLYAAIYVADATPHGDNARDDLDPHVWATASGVELMLQPGDHGDNRAYFEVQVDTNEAVWDTRFDDYNRPITGDGDARQFGHQSWDAQLQRSVQRIDGGYLVELALPWAALHEPRAAVPPAAGDVWRANLYSFRDGQRHALAWSPILGEGNFHRASRFGRLRFAGAP